MQYKELILEGTQYRLKKIRTEFKLFVDGDFNFLQADFKMREDWLDPEGFVIRCQSYLDQMTETLAIMKKVEEEK